MALRFRNESKVRWARYGQTASSALKNGEAKPLTEEELERVIRELYVEKVQRMVKQDGKLKFEGKWYHANVDLLCKTVDVCVTFRGMEVWYNGVFMKRWKYWENIIGIVFDYMQNEYLL